MAQKITQNCALFKISQKHPKKLPDATKSLKKAPENSTETFKRLTKIAQNFYKFVKSTQESSRLKN